MKMPSTTAVNAAVLKQVGEIQRDLDEAKSKLRRLQSGQCQPGAAA